MIKLSTNEEELCDMKKIIVVPALLVAIGGGFMLAQAGLSSSKANEQNFIKAAEAKQAALNLYGGTVVSFELDKDTRNPHYEIEIVSDKGKVEVEVDAVSAKAKITERESVDVAEATAAQNAKISQDEAVKIAQAQFAGDLHEIKIDEENNRFVYEVELRSATEKAEFDIDVETGEILKVEKKALKQNATGKTVANNNASPNNQSANNNVTNPTAVQNVQKNNDKGANNNGKGNGASNGNGSANTNSGNNGSANANNNGKGNANANAGKNQNSNAAAQKKITLDEAIQIALSKASGTVVDAELDGMKYEIEIRNGKMEYEFEIHAITGAILSYEEDLDD